MLYEELSLNGIMWYYQFYKASRTGERTKQFKYCKNRSHFLKFKVYTAKQSLYSKYSKFKKKRSLNKAALFP